MLGKSLNKNVVHLKKTFQKSCELAYKALTYIISTGSKLLETCQRTEIPGVAILRRSPWQVEGQDKEAFLLLLLFSDFQLKVTLQTGAYLGVFCSPPGMNNDMWEGVFCTHMEPTDKQ